MLSKSDVIKNNLINLSVLDIGGCGYNAVNPYEIQLKQSWGVVKERIILDISKEANLIIDLNQIPLPQIYNKYDITTAFDIIEHLNHPIDVLKWIPTNKLIISFPNALSFINRSMEKYGKYQHLYSFTSYTASQLLLKSNWIIEKYYFCFGKWSRLTRIINLFGSIYPSLIGTGIFFHCKRN
jgi:hypothetical protein